MSDTQPQTPPLGERFFFYYAILLFLIVAIGFPAHAIVNEVSFTAQSPLLHLHAVSMGLWFALLVVQTGLIGAQNIRVHKTLGVCSLLLVPVMVTTGIMVSAHNMEASGNPMIFHVNIVNVSFFGIYYAVALLGRGRPALHKRFMMFGSLCFMPPALARWAYALGLPDEASMLALFVLPLLIPAYDLIAKRKLTLASIAGIVLFIGYIAALFIVVSWSGAG